MLIKGATGRQGHMTSSWGREYSMIQEAAMLHCLCVCACVCHDVFCIHYGDVIMGKMASQITSLTIVYSTVNSGADQRKHESSASLAFVRGIHRWPVNSTHKWPVTRKMFPLDDVIMMHEMRNIQTLFSISRPCFQIAKNTEFYYHVLYSFERLLRNCSGLLLKQMFPCFKYARAEYVAVRLLSYSGLAHCGMLTEEL